MKPGNVLVPADGPVKVTDFGIAKAANGGDDLTRTGMVIGTARYLAPEQVHGEPADARADVYALGLVLLRDADGRTPFQGDTEMATALARLTTPRSRSAPAEQVPRGLAPSSTAASSADPAQRYPSADAARDALDGIARARRARDRSRRRRPRATRRRLPRAGRCPARRRRAVPAPAAAQAVRRGCGRSSEPRLARGRGR